MDALVKGADWAQMGTNGTEAVDPVAIAANKIPPERVVPKLRGRDSNPNFLIQSQASYR
jgi:hypothetical protein